MISLNKENNQIPSQCQPTKALLLVLRNKKIKSEVHVIAICFD